MNEISIMDILNLMYKKLWALILAFVVAATGAYGYCTFFAEPQFECTASILATNGAITNDNDSSLSRNVVASTDVAASISLIDTVVDLLKTNSIYKKTALDFDKKYTWSEIKGMTQISRRSDNTFIVDVKVTFSNSKDAIKIANYFAVRSCDYIKKFIPYSHVEVAQKAESATQVAPRTLITTAVSGVFGAVLLFAIFFIVDVTNHTIKSEEDFTKKFKLAVLGKIPDFEAAENEVARYKNYRYRGYKSYRSYRSYKNYGYQKDYMKYGYGGSSYGSAPTLKTDNTKKDGGDKNGSK